MRPTTLEEHLGPVMAFFAAVGTIVLTFFEVIGLIVQSAVLFVWGMITDPVTTIADTRRGASRTFRGAKACLRTLHREFIMGVPRPLQYLVLILSVALVIVVANHYNLASKRRAVKQAAARRMRLDDDMAGFGGGPSNFRS